MLAAAYSCIQRQAANHRRLNPLAPAPLSQPYTRGPEAETYLVELLLENMLGLTFSLLGVRVSCSSFFPTRLPHVARADGERRGSK